MLTLRKRFWLETATAAVSLALLVVTIVSPNWLESGFGFDPDAGSGAVEWMLTAAAACTTAIGCWLARRELRRRIVCA